MLFALHHNVGVMAFSLRQMELFRVLMQTRNVTEAARLLRISQPAASQALKDLEQRLGFALFLRAGNRIRPTDEARFLIADVEQMFVRIDKVEGRAAELRDTTVGSLSISTIATLTSSILPRALARFHASRPGVQLRVDCYTAREVMQRVLREEADIGIVYAPLDDSQIAAEPLLRTRLVCLLPQGHELAAQSQVDMRSLANQRLILLDPTTAPGLLVRERLPAMQRRASATIEVNLSFTALAMVRHGLGIVVTDPIILLSGLIDDLVVRSFEPPIELTLCLLFSRYRPLPRTVLRFVVELRAIIDLSVARLLELGVPAVALAR